MANGLVSEYKSFYPKNKNTENDDESSEDIGGQMSRMLGVPTGSHPAETDEIPAGKVTGVDLYYGPGGKYRDPDSLVSQGALGLGKLPEKTPVVTASPRTGFPSVTQEMPTSDISGFREEDVGAWKPIAPPIQRDISKKPDKLPPPVKVPFRVEEVGKKFLSKEFLYDPKEPDKPYVTRKDLAKLKSSLSKQPGAVVESIAEAYVPSWIRNPLQALGTIGTHIGQWVPTLFGYAPDIPFITHYGIRRETDEEQYTQTATELWYGLTRSDKVFQTADALAKEAANSSIKSIESVLGRMEYAEGTSKEEIEEIKEVARKLDAMRGPNAFADLYRYFFEDATYPMEIGGDLDKATQLYLPLIVGNSVVKGAHDFFEPIREWLAINPDEDNAFYRGMIFGGSMIGGFSAPLGVINIFKKGIITKVIQKGAHKTVKVVEGLPYIHAGSRTSNVLKEFMKKNGVSPEVPWNKIVPKDLAKIEAKMGIATAAGYAASDFFLQGTEYQNLSYFLAIASGFMGTGKYSVVDAGNRTINGLLYGVSRIGLGVARKSGLYTPLEGQFIGPTNMYMRSKGFKGEQLKVLEAQIDDEYRELVEKYGYAEARKRAKKKGLMLPDGLLNYDHNKLPLIGTGKTAAEIAYYTEMARMIRDMPNNPMKADLKASAERASYLLNKLARGIEGPAAGEKLNALTATFTDLLQLASFRNYQAQMLNRIELNPFGKMKKGRIVTDIEMLQRDIDIRLESVLENFNSLKVSKTADDATKLVFKRMQLFIEETAKNKIKVSGFLRSRLASWEKKYTNKLIAKTEEDAIARNKLIHTGDWGVRNSKHTDSFIHRSHSAIYGKAGAINPYAQRSYEVSPTSGRSLVTEVKYTHDGILTKHLTVSNEKYTKLFLDADESGFFINASMLDKEYRRILDSTILSADISSIIKVSPEKQFLGTFTESLRRRGLNDLKKNYQNKKGIVDDLGYQDKLKNLADSHAIDFSAFHDAPFKELTNFLENALIKHKGVIPEIKQLMSLREWHGLRSKLMEYEHSAFVAQDYKKYEQYDIAVNRFNSMLEKTKAPETTSAALKERIEDGLEDATSHFRENVVPFRNYIAKNWSKDLGYDPQPISHPSGYFMGFFSKGGQDNGHTNRMLFDQMFGKKVRERGGRMVWSYPPAVTLLMHQALGRAFEMDMLTGSMGQLEQIWGGVINKKVLTEWDKVRRLKQVHSTPGNAEAIANLGEISPTMQKNFEIIKNGLDTLDKTTADILAASFVGRITGRVGPEVLGATEASKIWVERFSKGDSISQRAELVNMILLSGPEAKLGRVFGITKEAASDTLAPFEGVAGFGTARDILPPSVTHGGHLTKAPIDIILESPLGQNTRFVKALQDIMIDEMLFRSVKFNSSIKLQGAAARLGLLDKGQRGLPKEMYSIKNEVLTFNPVIELGTDFNITAIRTFLKDNDSALKSLFGKSKEGREHLQRIHELAESMFLIKGDVISIPMKGMVGGYTLNMGMGRAYNVMKGVVSMRYMAAEGGILIARQKQAELMLKMFRDPAAGKILHDIFVRGMTDAKMMDRLRVSVFGAAGIELTDNQYAFMIALVKNEIERAAQAIQPSEDTEIMMKINEFKKKYKGRGKPPIMFKRLGDRNLEGLKGTQ